MIYLLLYVDDIVLTASSTGLLQRTITSLQSEFAMKDLGELHHFLGMHVQRRGTGLFLSQRQYMVDLRSAQAWLSASHVLLLSTLIRSCQQMGRPSRTLRIITALQELFSG